MQLSRLIKAIGLIAAMGLGVLVAHAQTGTVKSKSTITTEINAAFPNNNVGFITPALLRQVVLDMVTSYYDLSGTTSATCLAHQWITGLPTLDTIACAQPQLSDIGGITLSGNTTELATVNGVLSNGHCITADSNHNLLDGGAPCVSSATGVNAANALQVAYYAATGSVVSGISVGALPYSVTNGTVSRKDQDRWVDNFTEAPDIGVDCTNSADSTTAIQTWVNANLSGHLRFPNSCKFFTTSPITVTDGASIIFDSTQRAGQGAAGRAQWNWKGTNGGSACASTFSSCLYVLDFEHTDNPTVQNIEFNSFDSTHCADGFLKFDGNPVIHTGTAGHIIGNSFGNGVCANPNFVAVNISPTALNNHENYIVYDNIAFCSSGGITTSITDLTTNIGATTISSASNPFSAGMVGKRVRLSYANDSNPVGSPPSRGYFDTTVASFGSSGQITLAAPVPFTQYPVQVVVDQAYGIAYSNGGSQNDLQQVFSHLQYNDCSIGVYVGGGGVQMSQLSGGLSDIGVYLSGFIAQNTAEDFYASENDYIALIQNSGSSIPFEFTNGRLASAREAANGFLKLGGTVGTILKNNAVNNGLPNTNSVLIGPYASLGVGSLGSITGGSGYVAGTYTNVPLANLAGSVAAHATVVVSGGGSVNAVTITNQDSVFYYPTAVPGTTMTTANTNLGGAGSGFSVPVTALVSPTTLPSSSGGDTFGAITSINNSWVEPFGNQITWAQLGYDQFASPPVVAVHDTFHDIPNNTPGNQRLPCTHPASSCVLVDAFADQTGHGQTGLVGVQANMGSLIVASGVHTGFRATGQPSVTGPTSQPGGGTSYTAFQAYPEALASGGTTEVMFDAAWGAVSPTPINNNGPFYGFRAESPILSGGITMPLMYGFDCDKQKTGTQITTTWCFYNADAADLNFFAGPVLLGTNTMTIATSSLGIGKVVTNTLAPGAGGAMIALVCGTNAGTAKLVANAGTSTNPVTLLDNIGGGVTGC